MRFYSLVSQSPRFCGLINQCRIVFLFLPFMIRQFFYFTQPDLSTKFFSSFDFSILIIFHRWFLNFVIRYLATKYNHFCDSLIFYQFLTICSETLLLLPTIYQTSKYLCQMIITCIRHNFKTRRSRNASTDWRSCSILITAASDTAGSKLGA